MPNHLLTMAVVSIQKKDFINAKNYLKELKPQDFEQRMYLYYGAYTDYYDATNNIEEALKYNKLALVNVNNNQEKQYLLKKNLVLLSKKK